MNSYELDQPLDLRLKALNLSRALTCDMVPVHQDHYPSRPQTDLNLVLHSYCGGGNANGCCNLNTYLSNQQLKPKDNYLAHHPPPSLPPMQPISTPINILNPPTSSYFSQSHPKFTAANISYEQQQQSQQHNTSTPPISHQHNIREPTEQQLAEQHQQPHNIHCQPLNHHQPHPLSRLHPSPLVFQSQSSLSAGSQHLPNAPVAPCSPAASLANLNQNSSSNSSDMFTSFSPLWPQKTHHRLNQHQAPIASSLQNLAHHNSTQKNRQLSPPLYQNSHYHLGSTTNNHHDHNSNSINNNSNNNPYQPVLPVRSLSMSGQMLTPSHLSLMVSPTSTPPTSVPAPSLSTSTISLPVPQHRASFSSHSPLTRPNNLSEGASKSRSQTTNHRSNESRLASPINMNNQQANGANNVEQQHKMSITSRSPVSSPTSNCGEAASAKSGGSTSPIMRQHSLVSRYNCKPCGIVFSQPETLRAHQEGYCTKTNRNQLRSQSAVSPSSLQQSVTVNNNNGK